jgi:hypothetical protein
MSAMSSIQLARNVDDLANVAVSLGGAMVSVATAGDGLVSVITTVPTAAGVGGNGAGGAGGSVLGAAPAAPRLSRETRQGLTPMCHLSRGPTGRRLGEEAGTWSEPLEAS